MDQSSTSKQSFDFETTRENDNAVERSDEISTKKQEALKSMDVLVNSTLKLSEYFNHVLEQYKSNRQKQVATITQLEDGSERTSTNNNIEKSSGLYTVEHLKYFEGGTLKPYQEEGLLWLRLLFENGINGILADEMGLGKTIQVIALICYLCEKNVTGPFLIVTPMSVAYNWIEEFTKFAPKISVLLFHGDKNALKNIKEDITNKYKLRNNSSLYVVVTTYEISMRQSNFLHSFEWIYLIVDEGQRLKNFKSKLTEVLKTFHTQNKLLLTGTPLQNNLLELWSLLNFIVPDTFCDIRSLESVLSLQELEDDEKIITKEVTKNIISKIHRVLGPFMLRRLKCDVLPELIPKKEAVVYCNLTKIQMELYKYVLEKQIKGDNEQLAYDLYEDKENDDINQRAKRKCTENVKYSLNGITIKNEHKSNTSVREKKGDPIDQQDSVTKFKNLIDILPSYSRIITLKKIVDHPYLLYSSARIYTNNEVSYQGEIISSSCKMILLDAMLKKLKNSDHKVLIFSNSVAHLDIIEDYVIKQYYNYCRLDGKTSAIERNEMVKKFNDDSEVFLFLISTRAGGVGLNLTAADTVIFMDRDWNPQVDIQAQDRCHRIGQKKPVMVYSLIAKDTIDDKILHVSNMKRRLEKVIIKDRVLTNKLDDRINFEELLGRLTSTESLVLARDGDCALSESQLEDLLDRSSLYKQMEDIDGV